MIDSHAVRLASTGYDFGGEAWAVTGPYNAGGLHFHHDDGKIRPHLVGALHLDDADGTCGRIRMEYFDADDRLLSTEYGGSQCVDDDRHEAWSVDLAPYDDYSIDSVRVSVQREGASGWSTRDSHTVWLTTWEDEVEITADGVDFGGEGFAFGRPSYGATIDWDLEQGRVTPHLSGYLHLNNSSGVCARINMRVLAADGHLLDSAPSDTECASDNGHDRWRAEPAARSSIQVDAVTVQLQTLGTNGDWNTAGSETVSIGV